jgi:deoxyribonuclease-4
MVNIASPTPDFRRRSIALARATVGLADGVGATGVVVHAGSAGAATERGRALEIAAESLNAIAGAAGSTYVMVELTAGGAGSVASTFGQARELFDAAGHHPRLRLCVDTCHLFAVGYGLDHEEEVRETFAELRRFGLIRKLGLVHANDSKFGRGLRRDSHTHIGQGHIGEAGFKAILAHAAVRRCPVVCETPGRLEDTARNIATLRRLAA